jgi:hypothetical protein
VPGFFFSIKKIAAVSPELAMARRQCLWEIKFIKAQIKKSDL